MNTEDVINKLVMDERKTLSEKLVEVLKAGYEIRFYWEPNQNDNRDRKNLVIEVSKGDERIKYKFSRVEFVLSRSPDSIIEYILNNAEKELKEYSEK